MLPHHHDLLRPVLKKVLIHCKVELRDWGRDGEVSGEGVGGALCRRPWQSPIGWRLFQCLAFLTKLQVHFLNLKLLRRQLSE